jgi:hypothetical protein
MIFIGKYELSTSFIGSKAITQIYQGAKLVWEAIKSCFGAGFWKNDAPWSNTEGWKN